MAVLRPSAGRSLKTFFTIGRRARYVSTMLLMALVIAAAQPATPEVRPERPARALVRITRPASLRVGASTTVEGKPLRRTNILESNGKTVPAMLAEFE